MAPAFFPGMDVSQPFRHVTQAEYCQMSLLASRYKLPDKDYDFGTVYQKLFGAGPVPDKDAAGQPGAVQATATSSATAAAAAAAAAAAGPSGPAGPKSSETPPGREIVAAVLASTPATASAAHNLDVRGAGPYGPRGEAALLSAASAYLLSLPRPRAEDAHAGVLGVVVRNSVPRLALALLRLDTGLEGAEAERLLVEGALYGRVFHPLSWVVGAGGEAGSRRRGRVGDDVVPETPPMNDERTPSWANSVPRFSPTSPRYNPGSPQYSPTSPQYSPASPRYATHSLAKPGPQPAPTATLQADLRAAQAESTALKATLAERESVIDQLVDFVHGLRCSLVAEREHGRAVVLQLHEEEARWMDGVLARLGSSSSGGGGDGGGEAAAQPPPAPVDVGSSTSAVVGPLRTRERAMSRGGRTPYESFGRTPGEPFGGRAACWGQPFGGRTPGEPVGGRTPQPFGGRTPGEPFVTYPRNARSRSPGRRA